MRLRFYYPYWGSEHVPAMEFMSWCISHGFHGMEINFPTEEAQAEAFRSAIYDLRKVNPDFKVIAQQVLSNAPESAGSYQRRMIERLEFIHSFEPDAINSHTGKDHFTFEENCSIIEACEAMGQRSGIPIWHEIHRGRFTFHSSTLIPYLDRFPNLKLVGDFSHWCLVSESMLQDQEELLLKIIPHIQHVHARVGHEQGSQVNDPFAPEWQHHLDRFLDLWQRVIDYHNHRGMLEFSITPEFGPVPYMPTSPFDHKPLGDQKAINLKLKELLTHQLTLHL